MDDTQNNGMNPQPVSDGSMPAAPLQGGNVAPAVPTMDMQQVSSMGDIAGMTPPPMPAPALIQPEPVPVMDTNSMNPSVPSSPMNDMGTAMGASQPLVAMNNMPVSAPLGKTGEADDYAYAEDLLDEILDSLDRIEAKLEAIEKKVGQ